MGDFSKLKVNFSSLPTFQVFTSKVMPLTAEMILNS